MPTYQITAPDGRKFRVTGEGTAEEAMAQIQQRYQPQEADATVADRFDAVGEANRDPNLRADMVMQRDNLGAMSAFNTGRDQGATYGFSDEMAGGGEATERVNALKQKYPWLFFSGEILGGLATGGTLAKGVSFLAKAGGKGLATRMGAASADGAIHGTVYGTGVSDPGERTEGASSGLVAGAVAGPLFEVGATGARAVARRFKGQPSRQASQNLTEAESIGVPLDRGQATGDQRAQSFMEAARHGSKGDKAQRIVSDFDTRQGQALNAARDDIGSTFGNTINNPMEAGDLAANAVRQRAEGYRRSGDNLYKQARRGGVEIDARAVPSLASRVQQAFGTFDEVTSPALYPGSLDLVRKVERFANLADRFPGQNVLSVSLDGLEEVRQAIVKAKGVNANDARVVGEIKRAFDGWLDDAVDHALFAGDETAVQALKNARALWSRYRAITNPKTGDDAGRLMAKMADGNVDAVEATNWLLGSARTGIAGRGVRLISRLKKEFGADSEPVQALRQAMWLKLTRNPEGKIQPEAQAVSQAIREFTDGKGQALARTLYSADELKAMRKFANVLRMTVVDPKATNPSKSGFTMGRLAQQSFDNIAGMFGLASGGMDAGIAARLASPLIREGGQVARASNYVNNPLPAIPHSPTPGLPALAGPSQTLLAE